MSKKKLITLQDTTCYAEHKAHQTPCNRKSCNNWLTYPENQNCALIAASKGTHTLQQIGELYDLTRMRICQIEKTIYQKIKDAS